MITCYLRSGIVFLMIVFRNFKKVIPCLHVIGYLIFFCATLLLFPLYFTTISILRTILEASFQSRWPKRLPTLLLIEFNIPDKTTCFQIKGLNGSDLRGFTNLFSTLLGWLWCKVTTLEGKTKLDHLFARTFILF